MPYGIPSTMLTDQLAPILAALGQTGGIAQQGMSRQLQMTPEIINRAIEQFVSRRQQTAELLAKMRQQKALAELESFQRASEQITGGLQKGLDLGFRAREGAADRASAEKIAGMRSESRTKTELERGLEMLDQLGYGANGSQTQPSTLPLPSAGAPGIRSMFQQAPGPSRMTTPMPGAATTDPRTMFIQRMVAELTGQPTDAIGRERQERLLALEDYRAGKLDRINRYKDMYGYKTHEEAARALAEVPAPREDEDTLAGQTAIELAPLFKRAVEISTASNMTPSKRLDETTLWRQQFLTIAGPSHLASAAAEQKDLEKLAARYARMLGLAPGDLIAALRNYGSQPPAPRLTQNAVEAGTEAAPWLPRAMMADVWEDQTLPPLAKLGLTVPAGVADAFRGTSYGLRAGSQKLLELVDWLTRTPGAPQRPWVTGQ